jgi:hypothetical protein
MIWIAWLRGVESLEWIAIAVTERVVQVSLTTSRWVVEQWEGTQTWQVNLSISNSRKEKNTTSVFTVP